MRWFFSFFLFLFFLVSQSFALNPQVKQFVEWETRANNVAQRSPDPIKIEHYEIPLRVLLADVSPRMDDRLYDALILEKKGEKYVRWIINPEDTKFHLELEKWLKSKGLSTKRHKYFTAYQTASRSYVIEDPQTGYVFSGKVSTNRTGGAWKDKGLPIDDAVQIRMATDHVGAVSSKIQFDRLAHLPEPAMFGIEDLNQAFLVRSLGDMAEGKVYYLPAFSVMHDETARAIAEKNGATDVRAFWNENFNKPLAEALAEFAAHFGLTYDSGHGQNFLLELDQNMKPTGRVVLRDFADSYAQSEYVKSLGWKYFLSKWDTENIVPKFLPVSIGLLHGNDPPEWMSAGTYRAYARDFFESFEKKFSQLTGVPREELSSSALKGVPEHFSYMTKDYEAQGTAWKKYFDWAPCLRGALKTRSGKKCPSHLLSRIKSDAQEKSSRPPLSEKSWIPRILTGETAGSARDRNPCQQLKKKLVHSAP